MHSIGENGRLSTRAVPLIEDGSEPTPVDLHCVMPARDFLAPVGRAKEAISALLASLVAGEASSQDCICCAPAHCGVKGGMFTAQISNLSQRRD